MYRSTGERVLADLSCGWVGPQEQSGLEDLTDLVLQPPGPLPGQEVCKGSGDTAAHSSTGPEAAWGANPADHSRHHVPLAQSHYQVAQVEACPQDASQTPFPPTTDYICSCGLSLLPLWLLIVPSKNSTSPPDCRAHQDLGQQSHSNPCHSEPARPGQPSDASASTFPLSGRGSKQ